MAKNSKGIVFALILVVGFSFIMFAFVEQTSANVPSEKSSQCTTPPLNYVIGENLSGTVSCQFISYPQLQFARTNNQILLSSDYYGNDTTGWKINNLTSSCAYSLTSINSINGFPLNKTMNFSPTVGCSTDNRVISNMSAQITPLILSSIYQFSFYYRSNTTLSVQFNNQTGTAINLPINLGNARYVSVLFNVGSGVYVSPLYLFLSTGSQIGLFQLNSMQLINTNLLNAQQVSVFRAIGIGSGIQTFSASSLVNTTNFKLTSNNFIGNSVVYQLYGDLILNDSSASGKVQLGLFAQTGIKQMAFCATYITPLALSDDFNSCIYSSATSLGNMTLGTTSLVSVHISGLVLFNTVNIQPNHIAIVLMVSSDGINKVTLNFGSQMQLSSP